MEIVRMPRIRGELYIPDCCLYDCLATICNYYGENVGWIFYDYLDVLYRKKCDKYVYECLKLTNNIEAKMKKYFGIRMRYVNGGSDVVSDLKEALRNGKIILVHINVYWMPWGYVYRKLNYENGHYHYFIIEDSKDGFVCTDPYHNQCNLIISYEDLKNGCQSYVAINRKPKERKQAQAKEKERIEIQIQEIAQMDYWKELIDFSKGLSKEIPTFTMCQEREHLEGVHFALKALRSRCYYFTVYLLMIDGERNIYQELADEFLNICDEWGKLDSMFLKECIKKGKGDWIQMVCKQMVETIRL